MAATQTTTHHRIARDLKATVASLKAAQQVLDGMHVAIDAMPELRHNQYWTDAYRKATEIRDEMADYQTEAIKQAIEAGFGPEDF